MHKFFKDDQNCTSRTDGCNLKFLKSSCMFFQIESETILIYNNIHES